MIPKMGLLHGTIHCLKLDGSFLPSKQPQSLQSPIPITTFTHNILFQNLRPDIMLKDISKSLDSLQEAISAVKQQADQAENCRATLYVNFVTRETCGIRFDAEVVDTWTTHAFLLEVLLALKAKIESC